MVLRFNAFQVGNNCYSKRAQSLNSLFLYQLKPNFNSVKEPRRVVVNEPNPHEVEMIGGDQSDNPRSVLAFVFNYFSPYILIARTGELTLYDVGSTSTSGRSLLLWLAQDNSFSRVSLV
ncbi:hypothetical protein RRG08_049571 [Elysia crispata]|uniref:Uncharacterized protein n=1 Tax=Elysia crispata TaxID=231223 RepID=A0AAE1AUU3_9GAST|nr:hypothetical protein RRG08_049571 [Elysia crispata]